MGWDLRRRPLSALYCYHPEQVMNKYREMSAFCKLIYLKVKLERNFKGLQMFERSMPFCNKHRWMHNALHHSGTSHIRPNTNLV